MAMDSIPQLSEALERGILVLFIGADFSHEVTGLPSRTDLARDLAHRNGLDESLSLAEVAQRVSRGGQRWEFTDFIRNALDTTGKRPQAFHRRIVELVKTHQIKTIVTTAYDDLLELAFREASVGVNRVVRSSDLSFIDPGRPTLIKLYGDARQPDTLVVTEDDYYGLWQERDKKDLLDEVRSALRKNITLFLGYNLGDFSLNLLWREVLDRAGRFPLGAYAVWPDVPDADVQMWRDRGLTILDGAPLGIPTASAPRPTVTAAEKVARPVKGKIEVQSWAYDAGAAVASVAISASGDLILAGTLGKRVICLDQGGKERWSDEVGNQAWRAGLSADGRVAVVGSGSTRPWDRKGRGLYTFDRDGRLSWQRDLGASVWGLALAADGRTVAAGTDGHEVLVFDDKGRVLWKRTTPGFGWSAWVWAASLSADGQTVAIGSANKTMLVLDRGGNLLGQHRADADVFVVAVSADGQTVAAGSSDQQVYLLDRQGNLLWHRKLEDKVWAVALPADGNRLIVGAGEKEEHVRTFDRAGQPLWRRYVEGGISSVAASAQGEVIGVATRTGQVYFFDLDGEPIHHHVAGKNVRDVAVSADGRVAAAVSEDGRVYGFLFRRETPKVTRTLRPGKDSTEAPRTSSYYTYIERASGIAIGDGAQVIGVGQSHADAPASTLRSQLAEARSNLRLVEELKSQCVTVEIPPQLLEEERRLRAWIAELEKKLFGDTQYG
jgi:outer membrane protein assembly factor BamB